jgi:hypothetical protein
MTFSKSSRAKTYSCSAKGTVTGPASIVWDKSNFKVNYGKKIKPKSAIWGTCAVFVESALTYSRT